MATVRHLIWEEWNINHIARHNVTPDEVAEVCHGNHLAYSSYKGRLVLIGPTQQKRILSVILDPEPETGTYYPVTAYDASRKDRKFYRTKLGGET